MLKDDTVEITGINDETDDTADEEAEEESAEDASADTDEGSLQVTEIYVYVCGAVAHPDVYELTEGARAADALDAAGGFLDDADVDAINLAGFVYDGEQLYFPYEGEDYSPESSSGASTDSSSGLVNINTATLDELKTLSGIGDVKAAAIIEYREQYGSFGSIDEIMNVNGIGDNLYQQIKDYITV